MKRSAPLLFGTLLLSAACVIVTNKAPIRDHASNDLGCKSLKITHKSKNADRKRVQGCGWDLVYAWRCTGEGDAQQCQWERAVIHAEPGQPAKGDNGAGKPVSEGKPAT